MKMKWIMGIIVVFVVGFSLVKSLNLSPNRNNLWKQTEEVDDVEELEDMTKEDSDLVNQDPYLKEFVLANNRYELLNVEVKDNLGDMPMPLLKTSDSEVFVDEDGNIDENHVMIVVTASVENLSKVGKKECFGGTVRIAFTINHVEKWFCELSSNDFNNDDYGQKDYYTVWLEPGEKIIARQAAIIPKTTFDEYEDVLVTFNPYGHDHPRDSETRQIYMTKIFRYVNVNEFLGR